MAVLYNNVSKDKLIELLAYSNNVSIKQMERAYTQINRALSKISKRQK